MKTVYKVLVTVLSAAILPVLFFVPLLRFKMSLPLKIDLGIPEYSGIFGLIRSVSSQTEEQKELMRKLWEAISDKESQFGAMFTNRPWLYAFFVLFILTVLCAVALAIVPYFVKKKQGITLGVAGCGFVLALVMNACFDRFAKPLLNGSIGLKSLLGGGSDSDGLSSLLTGLIGNAVSVDQLNLSFAYTLTLLLFLLCAFTVIAGLLDDNKK